MNPMLVVGVVVAVLVVGAVAIFGMGGNNSETPSSETMLADDSQNMDGEMIGGDAMSGDEESMMEGVIEVEGGAFYYEPNEIRVKAGEEVTIKLNSVDMMHDFVIDELNVSSEVIPGGESTTVTFTPTEAGEYEFYCSVGEHRANGMFGTLIVE